MAAPIPSVSIALFGRIDLRGPDESASRLVVQSKIVGLLALLAVPTLDRYVRRNTLVGLLWPELDQERARTALRKALHALRAAIGADALLSRGDEELALASNVVWCDVAAFTDATDSGSLMNALQLYTGDLMPGFHLDGCWEFDRWLEEERANTRERAAGAAWAFAQQLEGDEKFTDAASMARRSVRFSWSDERALRRALTMLDRLGDRAGAIRLYEEFARRLRADLEVDPSNETVQLAEGIRTGTRPSAGGAR